jgi:hypothetical protein
MMLPPEVQFYEDVHLFVWRPRGVLDDAAINKVLASLEDLEGKLQAPFSRLSDTLAADEVELNFKYIIQVSLHRRLTYAGRPPVKSAILATDATAIHYGQLHSVLTQGSPIKVRVFQKTWPSSSPMRSHRAQPSLSPTSRLFVSRSWIQPSSPTRNRNLRGLVRTVAS